MCNGEIVKGQEYSRYQEFSALSQPAFVQCSHLEGARQAQLCDRRANMIRPSDHCIVETSPVGDRMR